MVLSFSPVHLKNLDEHSEAILLSRTIAGYMSTLDDKHLRGVSTRVLDETTLWLSRLFRMENATAYFDSDVMQGLVRVLRLVIHSKYPTFSTDGYLALQQKQPVIYINSACRSTLPLQLATNVRLLFPV